MVGYGARPVIWLRYPVYRCPLPVSTNPGESVNNSKLSRNVPTGYAIRVLHIHDPDMLALFGYGKPPRYVTQARIYIDKRHKNGSLIVDPVLNPPVVVEEARCSHKDCPSRKLGYHMAVTRALRTFSALKLTA